MPQLLTETLELLEADASQRAKEAGEQAAMAGQEREALWATVRELRATVEMSQVRLLLLLIQGWRWRSLDSQICLGHLWVELLSACVCWMNMSRHVSPAAVLLRPRSTSASTTTAASAAASSRGPRRRHGCHPAP